VSSPAVLVPYCPPGTDHERACERLIYDIREEEAQYSTVLTLRSPQHMMVIFKSHLMQHRKYGILRLHHKNELEIPLNNVIAVYSENHTKLTNATHGNLGNLNIHHSCNNHHYFKWMNEISTANTDRYNQDLSSSIYCGVKLRLCWFLCRVA
jgi:pyoverdine/dityrosine biosynthesis protein Dit1